MLGDLLSLHLAARARGRPDPDRGDRRAQGEAGKARVTWMPEAEAGRRARDRDPRADQGLRLRRDRGARARRRRPRDRRAARWSRSWARRARARAPCCTCSAPWRRRPSGSIALAGRRFEGLDDRELTLLRREGIGFVFQFFNLLPALTRRGERAAAGADRRQRATSAIRRPGPQAAGAGSASAPAPTHLPVRALRRRAAAGLDRPGAADGARAGPRRRADRQPRLALRGAGARSCCPSSTARRATRS